MARKRLDRITAAGLAVYAVSLVIPAFVNYRPSRILSGELMSGWEAAGPAFALAILLLLVLAALIVRDGSDQLAGATALFADLAAVAVLLIAGYAAGRLIGPEAPYARVSLSSAFWLALFGCYLMLVGSLRRYRGSRFGRAVLAALVPASVALMLSSGWLDELAIMREFFNRRDTFVGELGAHVSLSFGAVAAGAVVGLAVAYVIFRHARSERYLFFFINLFQTVPTLSFLGLLMAPLAYLAARYGILRQFGVAGIGWTPAFIVLFAYTLLPVTSNALAGFRVVDPMVLEAALGMGMTKRQVFWRVQFPLALPVVVSGIRTALTQAIGNTILAGLIGGGGMGSIIFLGLAQSAPDLVLLGTIPVVLLALVADYAMRGLSYVLSEGVSGGAT
ncbi:MAG: ABC transporter permease [Clostridia bacterium]